MLTIEVDALLEQMAVDDVWLTDGDRQFRNPHSVQIQAYVKAQLIDDPSIAPYLMKRLRESSTPERLRSYFLLEQLGQNTQDPRIAMFLMESVFVENRLFMKRRILAALAAQPIIPHVTPLLPLLEKYRRGVVRQVLLEILQKSTDKQMLPVFSEWLLKRSDPLYVATALKGLAHQQVVDSIPLIRTFLDHNKERVRLAAYEGLGSFHRPEFLNDFIQTLSKERSSIIKEFAMYVILTDASAEAIVPVIRRIKRILYKPRVIETSEMMWGLEYLLRYQDDPRVLSALDAIVDRKWHYLTLDEKRLLLDRHIVQVGVHHAQRAQSELFATVLIIENMMEQPVPHPVSLDDYDDPYMAMTHPHILQLNETMDRLIGTAESYVDDLILAGQEKLAEHIQQALYNARGVLMARWIPELFHVDPLAYSLTDLMRDWPSGKEEGS